MTAQGYVQPDLLVETDWLAARLDDSNIRIVDCDPIDVYRRAHIQHAIGIPVHHYIKQPEYTTDPRQYPLVAPPDTMQELMMRMGIGDDNLVVTYDSNGCLTFNLLTFPLFKSSHVLNLTPLVFSFDFRVWFCGTIK